jgi:hypothetical protein
MLGGGGGGGGLSQNHAPGRAGSQSGVRIRTSSGTSNDTELEKLKKRLQLAMHCTDCFVS